MLDEIQMQNNWIRLRELINREFSGERLENLNKMYDYFEERMSTAPASGREHFHNAFPGGYVDHVLYVIDNAIFLAEAWEKRGNIIDFTREELIFAAMHHDLYKVGNLEHDYYVLNDSQWHREKQGLIYKTNDNIMNNSPSWRTLFLLAHFKIPFTEIEELGMLCTDGLYSSDTEYVLKQFDVNKQLETHLPLILHAADMWAYRLEYDKWRRENKRIPSTAIDAISVSVLDKKNTSNTPSTNPSTKTKSGVTESQQKLFNDLFN